MKFNRNDENYVYGFIGKNIQKYKRTLKHKNRLPKR